MDMRLTLTLTTTLTGFHSDMTSPEIGALLARLYSTERKCSDEVGAEILAKSFPAKTYAEHLCDLKNERAIRDAKKAVIRLDNPDWAEWQVIDEVNCYMPPDWWEGDWYWENRFAWAGTPSSARF